MNKLQVLVVLIAALLISSCSSNYGAKLPYDSWRLGFFAPNYMEVWIETADVVDMQDRWFKRAMSGVAAIQTPPNLKGKPNGWPKRPGAGSGKQVTGADLPRFIYVRWQSLAEPQTYQAYIEIPEAIREVMLKGERAFCRADGKWITGYREAITIGLAPGGIAKTWVHGGCLDPIEVSRVQGTIFKKGPDLGRTNGRYAFELEPESQAYIDKFGIPYESW
ncbi:lipoprotein [Pseudomonas cichorii]|uniref:DUF2931 family protein n=1 Tax=Pseudomonas cichorii TaxID=36746 RepID=UPI001910D0B5|nr:DUF2931 family protein [Pseudomonas cichorii]GFM80340.1 lipoprotein [Pseudomonas cichorii]